jgi:hypothetical protein
MGPKDDDNRQVPKRDKLWKNAAYVIYTADEKGNYSTILEREDREFLLTPYFSESSQERAEEARKRVLNNESSPIEFFMYRRLMDPPALAQGMGIAVWRVKRHLRPDVFRKLDDKMLEAYAKIFNVDISELKNFKGDI